ncbi:MAG: beta-ketoacyl synthase N-terminal-like domain-containing protein, partial [Anaerolineales bacterium]|nr:beta-ketoacyl synthase N-terminal-like domain-containing protein [Anaerolineales bacterium]
MREIAILGIGQTKIDEHWECSLRDLAGEAALAALQDAGRAQVDGLFVGNMLSGMIDNQNNLAALIADWAGLGSTEAVKVEAACASGAAAFRSGLMAVASGELESALVVGVEKMTERGPHEVTAALATAADADYEAEAGVSFVGLNALIMRRYMHEYGWRHADFAPFSINAHANAMHNPFARLRQRITAEQFEKSAMVATPINLLDASPIGDGAAAALLVPARTLGRAARILVSGSASATDTIAIHDRPEALFLTAAYKSAQAAYKMAG